MRGKRGKAALAICMALILSLTACGADGSEEEAVSVQESEEQEVAAETPAPSPEIEEESEEEPEEEVKEEGLLTYVEENGLEFCDDSSVEVTGLALNSFDHSDYIETDVDFEWEVISIEDAEEGFKTITILETVTGYRWFDGREKKTDVIFPTVNVVDIYTGLIIPGEMTHYDMETEISSENIEWNGETYNISYKEEAEWNYENEWKPLTGDTFAGWCTLYNTIKITIPENYDGLALFLPSVLPLIESIGSDEYIMDYWADKDCYLFKVDMNAETEDKESNAPEESDADEADTSAAATKSEETKTQTTKQEEVKTEAPKQTHTHSYVETVTANPTCSNAGSKTFTCSCGDSYTESIPATGEHQWVENTEIIHHEEVGHNESTPINAYTFHCRGCGGVWTTMEEFRDHGCDHSLSSGSFYYTTETTYENTWVVDQEAWDEPITTSTCSVCGATR